MQSKKKANKHPKAYFHNIQEVLHDIFWSCDYVFGYSFKQLSEASGLSEGCLRNLYNGDTRFPRYDTIWLLSKSLGLVLTIEEKKKKRRLRVEPIKPS